MIQVGCLLLVFSFLIHGLELGSNSPLAFSRHSWAFQLRAVIKHDAELAGWVLIVAGLFETRRAIRARGLMRIR